MVSNRVPVVIATAVVCGLAFPDYRDVSKEGTCVAGTKEKSCGVSLLQLSRRVEQSVSPAEFDNTSEGFPILYSRAAPLVTTPRRGMVIMEQRMIGCFPRSEDDLPNDTQSYMDLACAKTENRTSPCRSGLPFFRLPLQEGQSFLDCFSFCLSKGLDLFGVMAMDAGVEECRCGASRANIEAWHGNHPKEHLLLLDVGVEESDPRCAMVAWQYTGGLENDGVPQHLMELTQSEVTYLDSITSGRVLPADFAEDKEPVPELGRLDRVKALLTQVGAHGQLAHKGLCVDGPTGYTYNGGQPLTCEAAIGLNWCSYVEASCPVSCGVCSTSGDWMPCYPGSCGGMKTWLNKNSAGKVIVNYFFDDDTLASLSNMENTKAAFRLAAQEYPAHTCIELVEGTADAPMPRIMVGHYDKDSCWASQQTSSSTPQYSGQINLGWCNDMHHKGSMIHEIAHVLGMNHEQKRSDAQDTITLPDGSTKGPHLIVHWEHISAGWVPQYEPAVSSYIGSSNQGPDDPHSGYAPYDYGSIMHYGRGYPAKFDAVQPQFNSMIGQRTSFSAGDILQLNDMYQCTATSASPAPTPGPEPPAPTAPPTPGSPTPAPAWSVSGPCSMDSEGCAVSPNYPAQYGVNEKCTFSGSFTARIEVEDFAVENFFDYLMVNDVTKVTGSSASALSDVDSFESMYWTSDFIGVKKGWKLCPMWESTPSVAPSANPTISPTPAPTANPTAQPTDAPTPSPTASPTPLPTVAPTVAPTPSPTPSPTPAPTPPTSEAPTPASTPAPTSNSTTSKSAPLVPIWRAGPWSTCAQRHVGQGSWMGQCDAGCVRTRDVTCASAATAEELPEASCQATMKLSRTEACICSTTSCQDQCNPGFVSMTGDVLSCSAPVVRWWCDHQSTEDPKMSATVLERCPHTCGICSTSPTPLPSPSPSPLPTLVPPSTPSPSPDGQCKSSCATSTAPWNKKCNWKTGNCAACSDCV